MIIANRKYCRMHSTTQSGVVLFVAMIMLLVLSLLGMMAASSAIVENKMAGSDRNRHLEHTAIASALSVARARIQQAVTQVGVERACAQLGCLNRDAAAPVDAVAFMRTTAARSAAKGLEPDMTRLTGMDLSARLAVNAIYVIEDLGDESAPDGSKSKPQRLFRVTASAGGGSSQFFDADEIVYGISR